MRTCQVRRRGAPSGRIAFRLPTMAPGDVQRLLDHTSRQGPVGVRYAILMLLARLGLRSVEVSPLQLDDVDWRCGEIVVRGKGRREDRLPLAADVGEALVAYLSGARPGAKPRYTFLQAAGELARVPHRPRQVYASRMFMISSALFTRPLPGELVQLALTTQDGKGTPAG